MPRVHFQIAEAVAADAARPATIRVDAMRPSLEAAGRFDAARARDRFLNAFRAAVTKILYAKEGVVGFFVVRRYADHLYLDHLYVALAYQGKGIGRRVIDVLKREARSAALPIRLVALNGSPAQDFYRACGFGHVSNDGVDTLCEWMPDR